MKIQFILAVAALAAGSFGGSGAKVDAKATFRKLKGLVGTWEGKNGSGMHERLDFQLIAGDSVLMETSHIDYHPNVAMVTMVHVDGDRLLLTHYCVAGNQPRLEATSAPDAAHLNFTFLDGTNIPTRNTGHMDAVKFHFIDRNHYSSRWSFYAEGKESWFEEFSYHRVSGKPRV